MIWFRGYFRTSAQRYLIEPLSSDDEGDHAVTAFNEKNFTPAVCGVTNTSWSDDYEPPTSRSRSRSGGISIVQQRKYIELVLVADNRAYVKMNMDQKKMRQRIFEIVNFLNMVYKSVRTFIALVGLEIWTNGDLISVTPPAGESLDAFMKWRNSELVTRIKHDNAHLISGINFEGTTVGLAFIGTLCSGHSVGVIQECTNPCCNATTCTLKEGSQCAEGECCENCKILPTARQCRAKQDDCDLAEYCDGMSTTCPEDVFAVNGLPCDGGQGYCYNGQCPQRPKQCVKMYGSDAKEAKQGCYNHNTRGVFYGFCKRPSKDQFIPCQKADVLCGKLFCEGGNDNPNYGQMVAIGTCKAAFFSDITGDEVQVETGTKCGDGKVCSQNQCVDLQTAYRNTNCSAKCPGHAVCNHKSECQCEPGWILPNCDSVDTAFSGTGKTIVIAVTVILVVLGIIAAIAGIIWKKRQSPILPTATTQRKQIAVQNPVYHGKQPPPSYPASGQQAGRPKPEGPPPPPPAAGTKPKPVIQIHRTAPAPPGNKPTPSNYTAVRQGLRPVPPPKV
ncbi:disintegrin and metalloproteinase domain-containing protein 28-like [Neolamprologus brichardi]|uniref:disintegrin and metalloproteinase domain-containing protein 28-like n=1 Tax=Neolamprologus brichardi TaxID=32507 RepID=UPI0003EC2FED|nr:disintegrin and metalloproteinase domain-containing protein 28-like [Neolamprologus brichardi]